MRLPQTWKSILMDINDYAADDVWFRMLTVQ